MYPNDGFSSVYETNNPTIATIGTVLIIVFTSMLFFIYDFFVRHEFQYKDSLSTARRKFVRFVSHEVRTPLNAVCLGLQLLERELNKPIDETSQHNGDNPQEDHVTQVLKQRLSEVASLRSDIASNAHVATEILNDLLNYDKVESGTLRLELSVISIFDLIESTAAEFRQQAKLKKITYTVDAVPQSFHSTVTALESCPDYHSPKVIGDVSRLSQVLRNLISNALKFTPEGGELSVRAARKSEGAGNYSEFQLHSENTETFLCTGTLQVEVKDTGAGMTPLQLKNAFEDGVQFDVNSLQSGQGSGLGLYIAKGIILQHGGSLTAASDGKGCGTTFVMSIPLYDIPETEALCNAISQETSNHSKGEPIDPTRFLVVDDSRINRKMMARWLRNEGHAWDEAEDGLRAVEAVRNAMERDKPYRVILMDYQMPEMTGGTAVQNIRAMGCDALIIGITGNVFSEDVDHFMECGANAVLSKPLDLTELTKILSEHRPSQ